MTLRRFIVGGASPNILKIPKELYKTGRVIGCNDWFLHDDCEYYVALDFGVVRRKWTDKVSAMYARDPSKCYFRGHPARAAANWRKANWFQRVNPHHPEKIDMLPTEYKGRVFWWGTTPTAMIHIAIMLGAEEIVLAGFDCHGRGRWNGYEYKPKDLNFKPKQLKALGMRNDGKNKAGKNIFEGWTHTQNWINRGMDCLMRQGVKIYKTLEASPLKCDFLDPTSPYALDPANNPVP